MRKFGICFLSVACASAASGEDLTLSYSRYGTPGLIDMPTAQSAPDAELALTGNYVSGTQHYTLTFQLLPRLSGSFRYTRIKKIKNPQKTYTRSFDVRYRFLDEGRYMPAMAVGFQDFVGTGQFSAEYIVATKHITPRLALTGGVGWGRLGSHGGVDNPLRVFGDRFKNRPDDESLRGGKLESKKWFRGDMGFFGGVAWAATDKLRFKAEYSSDARRFERSKGNFDNDNQFNFGVDYQVARGINLQGYYLYGQKLGAGLTISTNPQKQASSGYRNTGPIPVKPRNPAKINDMDWVTNPQRLEKIKAKLAKALQADGMKLEAVDFDARIVTARIRNRNYKVEAEMIGRAARIMTQLMPDSVSTFRIVPIERGIPIAAVSLRRGDLENLENAPNGATDIFARAKIDDFHAPLTHGSLVADNYPKFDWSVGPDLTFSYFDPDNPFRYEVQAKATAKYHIAPGLYLSGSINQPLFGTKDNTKQGSDSRLPHVRSDVPRYDRSNGPRLGNLTAAYFFRPGTNLYGRMTGGYLERMYGGVSGEMLWKPVDQPYGLGVEMNYVWQRDFNQRFGFRDYDVGTGHVSGYLELPKGFNAQLDLGRYLAKDWGGTLSIDREFVNGWKVGAYATITDVSAKDFGEGSFDKGITLSIPLGAILGKSTRRTYSTTIQPLTRDGGARVKVPGRLYDQVRQYHKDSLKEGQGRFWR